MNDTGQYLFQFCATNNLAFTNTLYQHIPSIPSTWLETKGHHWSCYLLEVEVIFKGQTYLQVSKHCLQPFSINAKSQNSLKWKPHVNWVHKKNVVDWFISCPSCDSNNSPFKPFFHLNDYKFGIQTMHT